ncbi:MAG: WD40 repeat domain-containing protein [Candidatus Bathyarchaeia archaeon]
MEHLIELAAVGVSQSGWVVFGFRNGAVVAKDLDGRFLFVLGPGEGIVSMAFLDENRVAIGSPWAIRIHDRSGKIQNICRLYRCWLKSLAGSEIYLAAGVQMDDSESLLQIHLWKLHPHVSAEPVRIEADQDFIEAMAISPDGRFLASGGWDGTVHLWRIEETGGDELPRLEMAGTLGNPAHAAGVLSVAISPDSKMFATSSYDGTLRIWNQDGDLLDIMRYREDYWYNLFFSPTGCLLSQGHHTIARWNPSTGMDIFYKPRKKIEAANFVKDEGIAIVFWDGTTEVWYQR